ncbi:MAG: hypothetical protein ABSB00_01470 [Minisyncoccia bacterium]|jgi:multisubunit Na+/H+ antiporter MnhG subunit
MKDKINSYLAILLITIEGAVAAFLIIRVAYSNNFVITMNSSEANYSSLQQLIPSPK